MVLEFASTSKVTFAGSGFSALAASCDNIAYLSKLFGVQIISYDKVNQLRHVRYLKDKAHTIEIMKKTKRSEGIVDIKPDIMHMGLLEDGGFTAIISAGSNANLKCEVLLEAMKKYIDGFVPEEVAILRTGILNERGEPML